MEEYIKMLEKCNLLLTDNMTGLSSWITILTVLITVIAALLPFLVTDRQHKFEKETESKFKDFEKEIDKKISDIESKYKQQDEKIEKNHKITFRAVSCFFREQMIKYLNNFEPNRNNNLLPYQKQNLFYDAIHSIASYINALIIAQDKENFNNAIEYLEIFKKDLKKAFEDEQTNLKLIFEIGEEKYFVSREKLKNTFKNDAQKFIAIFQFLYDEFDKKNTSPNSPNSSTSPEK